MNVFLINIYGRRKDLVMFSGWDMSFFILKDPVPEVRCVSTKLTPFNLSKFTEETEESYKDSILIALPWWRISITNCSHICLLCIKTLDIPTPSIHLSSTSVWPFFSYLHIYIRVGHQFAKIQILCLISKFGLYYC